MRIQSIKIDRAAHGAELRLNDLHPGMNVVLGENGSGKSTVVQFLARTLFGPEATADSSQPEGTLQLEQHGRLLYVEQQRHRTRIAGGGESVHQLPLNSQNRTTWTGRSCALRSIDALLHESRRLTRSPRPERRPVPDAESPRQLLSGSSGILVLRQSRDTLRSQFRGWYRQHQSLDHQWRQSRSLLQQIDQRRSQCIAELRDVTRRIEQLKADSRLQSAERRHEPAGTESTTSRLEPVTPATGHRDGHDRSIKLNRRSEIYRSALQELRREQSEILAHINELESGRALPEPDYRMHRAALQQMEQQLAAARSTLDHPAHQCDRLIHELQHRLNELCQWISHSEWSQRRQQLDDRLESLRASEVAMKRQLELTAQTHAFTPKQVAESIAPVAESFCRCSHSHTNVAVSRNSEPPESWVEPESMAQQRAVEAELESLENRCRSLAHEIAELTTRWLETRRHSRDLENQRGSFWSNPEIGRQAIQLTQITARYRRQLSRWSRLDPRWIGERILEDPRTHQALQSLLLKAAEHAAYLTQHEIAGLDWQAHSDLIVIDRMNRRMVPRQLSRGLQDQLSLALQLAVVNAWRDRGVHLPLLLDDVFVHYDTASLRAAIELLWQMSQDGQQVICLTCQESCAEALQDRGAVLHRLKNHRAVSEPQPARRIDPAPEPAPSVAPQPVEVAKATVPVVQPVANRTTRTRSASRSSRRGRDRKPRRTAYIRGRFLYYLEMSSSIAECPSIDPQLANRLDNLSVHTAADLLSLLPDGFTFRHADLKMDPVDLFALQSQALMMCQIPMLDEEAAQTLVGCGITNPRQLADMTDEMLQQRVARYLRGRHLNETARRERIVESRSWIRRARRARTLWESREAAAEPRLRIHGRNELSSRESDPNPPQGPDRPGRLRDSPHQSRSNSLPSREHRSSSPQRGSETTSGSSNSLRSGAASSAQPDQRPGLRSGQRADWTNPERSGERRAERTPTDSSSPFSAGRANEADADPQALRFYLHQSSPVEDAPEIGPRMAERLEAIGIRTVRDLLNAEPRDVVRRLRQKRVKLDRVQRWQLQATLVCRIPQLRGHDAQILVACHVKSPEDLATRNANQLFAIVKPFVRTTAGTRILRGSSEPDLDEITDWILWARQARQLRAA